jgi:hypothetical protein
MKEKQKYKQDAKAKSSNLCVKRSVVCESAEVLVQLRSYRPTVSKNRTPPQAPSKFWCAQANERNTQRNESCIKDGRSKALRTKRNDIEDPNIPYTSNNTLSLIVSSRESLNKKEECCREMISMKARREADRMTQ